ncbi:histone-lysine N-methyltransferase Clr4 [Arthroderma uncinatum]|uniref:histone-lysine N-methyltransferase Clr4 n=1 Tax=Arthroderma uncinatum TaxID=74035 RepID=UPI00144ABE45|nr:histone-lysine N-methyltransferase Clr4 [Arthroderma uncinatum]KAF3480164.1 histone-lysine N-methyltransferase Clr4 [Arthroderma uncinatum]
MIEGPRIRFISKNKARNVDFNFDFIKSYKFQDGLKPVGSGFIFGCSCNGCTDECESCLPCDRDTGHPIMPYQEATDRLGRPGRMVLRPDFIERKGVKIRECSPRCDCYPTCGSHVVYAGRQIELEVFETPNRGFGIRCTKPILKGQFIDTYVGELIKESTSDKREDAFDADKHASYLFSLDLYKDDGHGPKNEKFYVVDGRKFGSITRFMNHSCNPNCKMFPAAQSDSRQIYEIAFFAIRDIPAGTELTFDYLGGKKRELGLRKADPSATKCLCGERKCRGLLWTTNRKTKVKDAESSSDESDEE